MAIANIVCRSGVGPASAIKFFVTHGLGSAPLATLSVSFNQTWPNITQNITLTGNKDTHDYPFPVTDNYKKHLKRQQEILKAREEEKLNKSKELRAQLEKLMRGEADEEIEQSKPVSKKQKAKQLKQISIDTERLNAAIQALEAELSLLQKEQEVLALEYRRWRDEEDMKVILQVLNAPFEVLHKTIQ